MNKPTLKLTALVKTVALLLTMTIFLSNTSVLAQVIAVTNPTGGFHIDGDLKANTPTVNAGDWAPGTGGTGTSVFDNSGISLYPSKAYRLNDAYGGGDDNFSSSKAEGNPNTEWSWAIGSVPNKNDVNNGLCFFEKDGNGDYWMMLGADRMVTTGTAYIDFELLQNTITKNANFTFTSAGPHGGRTIGDINITVLYNNGGGSSVITYSKWSAKAGGGYEYVPFDPGAAGYATTNSGTVSVPFGGFGITTYAAYQFVEAGVNLSKVVAAASSDDLGLSIKSVLIKSKASTAATADLKDFTGPLQVAIKVPVKQVNISGKVYDDANGMRNGIIDGTATNVGGTLYANLVYGGVVEATTTVAANGTYSFLKVGANTDYTIVLSNVSGSNTSTLPSGWASTGEDCCDNIGSDGTADGAINISTGIVDLTNINFGIDQIPTANAVTASSQTNPGGTVKVTVPTLNGSDPEQGSFPGTGNLDTVIIKTLPTDATLYYNNVAVVAGDTIKNYNPTLLTIDPSDVATTISFTYVEIDAALQSSTAATVSMTFTTLLLNGNVYDDANALKDGTVNGTGTNAGNTLYAQLLNSSNVVIATTAVAANGTFTFAGLNAGTYSVLINTSSSASTSTALPTNWVNTGEFNGTGVGSDGLVNGISASITLSASNINNINFGIEQLPTANAVTSSQSNPGNNVKITVPTLNGTDHEQGTFPGTGNLDTVIIKNLPTNGTLYYNNVAVVAGDTLKNYNPALLTVDPNDGALTVSFTYVEVDAALQSSASANVSMTFSTLSISGNVYDDANALQDATVNGAGTNAGNTLYAQLLNSSNVVIATSAVAADGTFSFAGLSGGTYNVTINNSSTASTVITLPNNWINTGEFNGTGVGNDGVVNGTSADIILSSANISNINFGVEQLPSANAVTAASQVNPGGNVKVTVPALNGSDPEQGSFPGTGNLDTVIIKTLPTNATLYYNNVAVAVNDIIKNYNPSLLTVDPNDGAITVSFTYTEVDAALQSSDPATVSMTFTTLSISGNVYDDANALQDAMVNGVGTNADNTLYAQLLNNSNVVIATTSVANDGSYSFAGLNGGTYSVLINISSTASTSTTLPDGWLNTGEFNGTGVGNDGNVNGTSAAIILSTTNITNVNFGVEQLPSANAVIGTNQTNPGGSVKVTVPTLNGSDPEQGIFAGTGNADTIVIRTLPGNAVLYYNNVAVVAGDTIKNYNPTLLTVDPNNGPITVSFTYAEIDAALQSSSSATVIMPFGTVILSGNVYDDANALQDGIVNGDGTNADNTLYAQLMHSGVVIATVPVASNGSYSFTGLNGGTYSVLINTSSSASTSTDLPVGWLYTGEFNGTGAGSDGLVDGTSTTVSLTTSNISNVNFGIEQLPTANTATAASQVNPGGSVKVVMPTLNGNDPEQGGFPGTGNSDTVIIKTLPTNAVLYYNNIAVVAGDTIKNYNPSLLTADPNDGAITVTFTYAEVDAALQSSGDATASMSFTTVSISGNVYDDADALQDETVSGAGTNVSNTLYAQLLNNSNVVIATTAVASNGTYSFAGLNGGVYSVLINNSSAASASTVLPTNWLYTGEFIGTGIGNDGNANGASASITLSAANVTDVNFGIEQLPTANAVTTASQVNPGGAIKVTVPTLNGSDPEQGIFDGENILDTVIIRTLPVNATLYYNNIAVIAGDTIKNYNPTLLTVDPNDGAITVSFTYAEVDAALQSSSPASMNMDFTTVSISGNVYDDANALQDASVNGLGTNAGNTLYAQLLNNSNVVIATTSVASNGTYSFAGLNGGIYSVLINTSSSASTSTTLPSYWLNTGEFNGTGVGNDGNVNGTSALITLSTADVSNVNFGVEQLPTANVVTAASQVNPGGSVKVTVPTLNGSDPEQGTFAGTGNLDTVIIKTLPTNATLYYNNVAVVAGDVINNYDPSLLQLDPNDGAITVSFTYAEIDAALQESKEASVSMSFSTVSLSGNVYDDANALQDSKVNGTGTNAGNTLYAQLLNNNGVVIATTAVAADGTYNFDGLNGGTYSVIINNISSSSTLTNLPANWVYTGEFNGTGVGNDGNVNGTSVTVVLSTASVSNLNFGIEQLPVANTITAASQVNPGETVKVTVPTLTGNDGEDGAYTGNGNTVIVHTIPNNGILYYNNIGVVAGDTIKNYNPALLTVDPNDGAITVSFTFSEVDAANLSGNVVSANMPFTTISISGNVYDDANALQDATVNGTGTNANGTLYAQLLDASNAVQAIVAVAADGTYSFSDLDAGAYSVVINTSSTENATTSLPANYVNTGEFVGTGIGNDGNANGVLSVGTITADLNNANFGIEQLPVANVLLPTSQVNPGGTVKVTVPTLTGSDAEDGTYSGSGNTIIINTIATNGTLYYNNVAVVAGDTIKNYNPSLLQVDPNDGAVTVSFTFSEVDAANLSSSAVSASMSFSTISISGNVYDDANALQDATVNGTGTNVSGTLYAQLLNVSNAVQATVPVAADGTYAFNNLDAGTYSVVINTSSSANATASVPANYVNTGEFVGTGIGNDGNTNGILSIGTISSDISNANFGIEQLPTADELIVPSQVNPGGNVKVTVPTLTGSDPEDGTYSGSGNTIIINTIATNGTLYYNNVAVVAGDTIKNYTPSLLQVDPNDGAITVSFTFSEVDAALLSSAAVNVSLEFGTIEISGNVYDDANALQDQRVNGAGTNAGATLYAQLLNNSNVVIATTNVAGDGTYSFAGLNGGTYSVLINTSSSSSASTTLPAGWLYTGEFNGTGVGNDGNVNGTSASVVLSTTSITNVNFGVEQLPTANTVTAVSQVNPGGTTKVTVPTLNGNDPEQGIFDGVNGEDTIIIKTLPTNATLYYNNIAVVAGDTIKNYDPALLLIDPNNGAITASFTYAEVDAALQSSTADLVTMTFTTLSISGNVYDDKNALLDNTVNGDGVKGSDIDPLVSGTQKLYVQLLNPANTVIATAAVQNNGTYSFTGLDAGTYSLVINQTSSVLSANNVPSLPTNWVNTGENLGTGPGHDGLVNGNLYTVTLSTTNVTDANLGIEKMPVANPVSALSLFNPGGTKLVNVPVLNGNDLEDGVFDGFSGTNTIIIQTLPNNGILYYDNVAVVAGDTIKNYDPSLLNVDPDNGYVTMTFTYSEVDAAHVASAPAIVTLPFGVVLPVTLVSFNGKMNGSQAELNWISETETNSNYFEVERSSDGVNFVTIGKVTAKGVASTYQFFDPTPANGFNCYRLKMVDKSGKIIYSKIVTVKSAASIIAISSVKPNPFVNSIDVTVDLQKGTDITTVIFDESGKTVYQSTINGTAGVNMITVKNLDKLSTGMYIVQVTAANNVVQKKILKGK